MCVFFLSLRFWFEAYTTGMRHELSLGETERCDMLVLVLRYLEMLLGFDRFKSDGYFCHKDLHNVMMRRCAHFSTDPYFCPLQTSFPIL